MRAEKLMAALAEIQRRWLYHIIQSNVGPNGERRRDDAPWTSLLVIGDVGPDEGHECLVYDSEEGCVADGHGEYRLVASISYDGEIRYVEN